jgi:Mn2+/Fe2+ NRAMP family transporter
LGGLTLLLPEIVWSVVSALVGAVAAWLLRRRLPDYSVRRRTFIAMAAALAPSFIIVGWISLPTGAGLLLSMSLGEFLIPFAIQLAMILIISAPFAWLVSRRKVPDQSISDIFR